MGWFSIFLDANGDGTGSKDGAVDGSSTPVVLKFDGISSYRFDVNRLVVQIVDVGAPDAGKYGNNLTLTNGIDVEVFRNDKVIDLLDGTVVKTNSDWSRYCYDVNVVDFGTGDDYVNVRWTFSKAGEPIRIRSGDTFRVRINDDLTGLAAHTFCLQGIYSTSDGASDVARFVGT